MKNFETKTAETMCLDLTIVKKKWCILFVYLPPNTDKDKFFDKVSVSHNKISGKYENILAGDLNIDELRPCSDCSKNYLSDMKDIFSPTNVIKEPTCFKLQNSTLLDLVLTNRCRSFLKSPKFEKEDLNDFHKLSFSILRAAFKKLPPKIIKHGERKYLD